MLKYTLGLRVLTRVQSNYIKGHRFEEKCYSIFRGLGYKNVELGPCSRDGGLDITMEEINKYGNSIKIGVECKNISGNVGRPVIQKLYSAALEYGLNEAWIVTTRDFSKDAYECAYSLNTKFSRGPKIKLINGNTLKKMNTESKTRSTHIQSDDPNIINITFVIIIAYILWKYVCV